LILDEHDYEVSRSGEMGRRGQTERGNGFEVGFRDSDSIALLLEQILERLSRIERPRGGRRFRGNLGGLRVGCGRRVLLHRHPEFVEVAIVLGILRRYARRHRLRAFELCASIKEPALLAAMQLETTLRTFALGIEARHQHRSTIRAASPRYRADHARRSRPQVIGRPTRSTLGWFAILSFSFFVLFLLFGLTIAAVTVLAIHKRLRPSASTDCDSNMLDNRTKAGSLR